MIQRDDFQRPSPSPRAGQIPAYTLDEENKAVRVTSVDSADRSTDDRLDDILHELRTLTHLIASYTEQEYIEQE